MYTHWQFIQHRTLFIKCIQLWTITMNPSDWIKAAALVTQHKQEAAITETDQLSSMPLSQLAMDDSGPPVVHYGTHMPAATSTPTGTEVHVHSSQQEDSYQQIIPGIPRGSLYPTISSLLGFLVIFTAIYSISVLTKSITDLFSNCNILSDRHLWGRYSKFWTSLK